MVDGTLALSIPGLFLTCVQYFHLVQLGRNFKDDFGSCLLKLQAIELRLQRWGNAAGITDNTSEAFVERLSRYQPKEIRFAYIAWKEIERQLKRAQEDSELMVETHVGAEEELKLINEIEGLEICEPPTRRTSRVLGKIKSGYNSSLTFTNKAADRTKWALYKKKQLEELLSKTDEHVTALEKLFPEQEKALVVAEAKAMEPEIMETLAPILDAKDPLNSVIQGVRKGFRYEDIDVLGNAAPHFGSNYREVPQNEGQTIFKGLKFSGNSSGHAGNNYGYDKLPAQRYPPAGHLE